MRQLMRAFARGVLACAYGLGFMGPAGASVEPAPPLSAQQAFAAAPLAFEINQGQVDPSVSFLARAPGYQLFLTARQAVMVFSKGMPGPGGEQQAAVLRMRFEGANPRPAIRGEEPLPLRSSYFVEGDGRPSPTDVRHHGRVRYTGLYPGVDLLYYGNQQQLEYDLLLAPNADPASIRIRFEGAERPPAVSARGDLVVPTGLGDVVYRKPVAYQEIAGERRVVAADYRIAANGEIGFRLGRYDDSQPLVIDPILSYASYIWGSARALVTDTLGNAYVVGSIFSSEMPAATGYLAKLTGSTDAYVAKINPSGTQQVWGTYLGVRRSVTNGIAVAVDAAGNVYVAGTTNSASYPVTAGAYQTSSTAGGTFLTKLNASGNALVYSTFVGGTSVAALALDAAGNAYLTGTADALATTAGAFQASRPYSGGSSPFVAKLNAAGSAMAYATYLGGAGSTDKANRIAVDAAGSAYVTGTAMSADFPVVSALQGSLHGTRDAFVAKLNPSGSALVYSTYLGGAGYEYGNGIAVDAAGQAYVAGQTYSDDFPVTAGVFQPRKGYPGQFYPNGFIAKFNAGGNGLVYSSYVGGNWCQRPGVSSCSGGLFADGDAASVVAVDAAGHAYVAGMLASVTFAQVEAIHAVPDFISEYQHVPFLTKVRPAGDAVAFSVVLGTNRNQDQTATGVAVDPAGGVFAIGDASAPFPFTAGALKATDGTSFLVKLTPGSFPTTVRSSANPSTAAQSVALIADVQGLPPGGIVTFYSGATSLGSAPVVGGKASLDVALAAGIHRITAVNSTDGKASPPLFQQVRGQ